MQHHLIRSGLKLVLLFMIGLGLGTAAHSAKKSKTSRQSFHGQKIDLKVKDAELASVLHVVLTPAGFRWKLSPGSEKKLISAEFNEVAWDQVVHQILQAAGLTYEISKKTYLIREK